MSSSAPPTDMASARPPSAPAASPTGFLPPTSPSATAPPDHAPLTAPVTTEATSPHRTSRLALTGFALAVAATVGSWAPVDMGEEFVWGRVAFRALEVIAALCAVAAIAVWWGVLARKGARYAGTAPLAVTSALCLAATCATLSCIGMTAVHPVAYLQGYSSARTGDALVVRDEAGHRDEIRLVGVREAGSRQSIRHGEREIVAHFRHTNLGEQPHDLGSLGSPQLLTNSRVHAPAHLSVGDDRPVYAVRLAAQGCIDVWATYYVSVGERPEQVSITNGHWQI